MRRPPVRSYIQSALPSSRASRRSITPPRVEQRDEERQDAHEVRRVLERALAFVEALVDQPELALLQVAQAAVHELGALRARARREVVALDERGAQAPAGGVERHAGAGDAAADHEHVERLVAEPAERRGPIERRRSRSRPDPGADRLVTGPGYRPVTRSLPPVAGPAGAPSGRCAR